MKACGTKELVFSINELKQDIIRFGVYLKDLQNIANNANTQETENTRLFGYRAKMTITSNAFIWCDKVLDCILYDLMVTLANQSLMLLI